MSRVTCVTLRLEPLRPRSGRELPAGVVRARARTEAVALDVVRLPAARWARHESDVEVLLDQGRGRSARIPRHPVLGPRLAECAEAMLAIDGKSATAILGSPDDLKLKSCATLFAHVSPPGSVFERILDKFYDGERDAATLRLLSAGTPLTPLPQRRCVLICDADLSLSLDAESLARPRRRCANRLRNNRFSHRRSRGSVCALAFHMITPSTPRVGAIAAVSLFAITGCTPASLGVSPETVLATVIANLPSSTTTIDELRSNHSGAPTHPGLTAAVVRRDARAPHGGLVLRRQVCVGRQHAA